MKLRSRALGLAAAAGFVAGGLATFNTPAHAAVNVLTCQKVHGTASAKPGVNWDNVPQSLSFKMDVPIGGGAGSDPVCSGPLAGTLGPITKLSGALKTQGALGSSLGTATCSPDTGGTPPHPTGTAYPASGTVKTTFTNTYVFNGKTLVFSGQSFVTQSRGPDPTNRPEEVVLTGLVMKGPGVSGTVVSHVLQQPIPAKAVPKQAGSPSSIDASGNIVPSLDSALSALACRSGTVSLTGLVFSSQGTSLTSILGPNPAQVLDASNGGKISIDL